jgi:hypothetical protein
MHRSWVAMRALNLILPGLGVDWAAADSLGLRLLGGDGREVAPWVALLAMRVADPIVGSACGGSR